TGIGIAPAHQKRIFQAFTQVDGSATRRFGGTGLGLSISTYLVRAMGGRLWLDSRVGQGSTFHFTARFPRDTEPAPAAAHVQHGFAVRGAPVLVVDDNATNRRLLVELLTHWGLVPTAVDCGRAAIEALGQARSASAPFVLVLLDALMPDVDGFTVAEAIQ